MQDSYPAGQGVSPGGPGSAGEAGHILPAPGVGDVRGVALRGERVDFFAGRYPGLDAIHEDDPAAGRTRRGEQQRVVAAGSLAADGTAGEAAVAVHLEPLR